MGAALIHAERGADRHTEGTDVTKEIGAICDFAKAPKMYGQFVLLRRIFHWNLSVVAQKYTLRMYCISRPDKGCYFCAQLTSILLGMKG